MKEITNHDAYFRSLSETIARIPLANIETISDILIRAYEQQRTIYLFGNGGSAALASHFACDLAKGTINGSAKRFRVLALTDNVPLMTAWANDSSYEDIFAEQLAIFAGPGDVAFAISASGNSPNILRAVEEARDRGAVTIGLCGFGGGRLAELADHAVVVASDEYGPVEDIHLVLNHAIAEAVRASMHAAAGAAVEWLGG